MSALDEPAIVGDDRRAEAIAASGWGRPFRLVQPHNLAFWVWIAGIAYGTWSAFQQFSPLAGVGSEALTVGAIVAVGFGVLLWLFFRSIDRYDRLPIGLLVCGFLWGGLAATYGMAIHANTANIEIMSKLFGQGFASDWGAAISAPLVEESAKACGFLLLFTLAPALLHSPRAALMAGAFVGLGFQILEDDLYSVSGAAQSFYVDQADAVLSMSVLRILTGLISHPAYAGLVAVGILYLIGTPAVRRNVPRGLLFILFGLAIHGIWDGAAALGDGNGWATFGAMLVSTAIAVFGLWWAFRLSQPLEQRWMHDILAPEVAAGHLSTAEIDAAAGRRRERRAFVKQGHGRRGRRHGKHVLEAVIDLAHELAASGGADTPAVEHARAEVLRLRA